MGKVTVIQTISFDTIQNDILYCIKAITEKETLPESIIVNWRDDVIHSEINNEIIDNLDDILFLHPDYDTVMLYKKLNYLITLAIAKKLNPDILNAYAEGNMTFGYLEEQLELGDVESNMLDLFNEELALDYDSIEEMYPKSDDEDYLDNDTQSNDYDPQFDDTDGALGLGLSYIMYQYAPENNKNNSETTLKELTGLFDEILDRVFENGEISLTFKKDMIFRYYLHSDKDNIHIKFNVNCISGNVIILNPVTEQPMNIDIFTDWWKIEK